MDEEERRERHRRDEDRSSAEWRGAARLQLQQHEARLGLLSTDLHEVSITITDLKVGMATMAGDVRDLREDIRAATSQLQQGNRDDIAQLQRTIIQAKESTRNMLLFVFAPIVVAIASGLILFALTAHAGH